MSENPIQAIFQTFQKISNCIQTQLLSSFAALQIHPFSPSHQNSTLISLSKSSSIEISSKGRASQPVTKEALGSATWTFLHTLAAQFPERPSKQQKKDVKELMAILSRTYPCKECADHFKEVLRVFRANPVQAGSQAEFSQWLCHVHNVVNRSLGKPMFPCERVDARWGKLDCEQRMCDLQGTSSFGNDIV